MSDALSIVLVGAGNMGGAMLAGWLEGGHPGSAITVVDPNATQAVRDLVARHGATLVERAAEPAAADLLIVAVKPQMMGDVLPTLTHLVGERTIVVSVAAGTTVAQLAAPFFADRPRVVRTSPAAWDSRRS